MTFPTNLKGHVICCTRNVVYITTDSYIIYSKCDENDDHKLVLYQNIIVLYEDLYEIKTEDIESRVPDSILALSTSCKLYYVPIDKIVGKEIQKNCAIICGRLCLSSKTRWGITSKGLYKYTFKPRDHSYPTYIVSSKSKPNPIDVYAKVEIQSWENTASHPKGILVETLSNVTDSSCYEDVILTSHQVLPRNRKQIIRAESKVYTTGYPDIPIDEDWKTFLTMSIDPQGSMDIDDALSVRTIDGETEYAVHIATPTIWFDETSPTHVLASSQITSIYTNNTTHHLLPSILSINKASLLQDEERVCLSVIWSTSKGPRLARTKIVNKYAYSYEEAEKTSHYNSILSGFKQIWNHKPDDSHVLVEESMIKANMFVAQFLVEHAKEATLLRKTVNNSAWYLPYSDILSNNHESLCASLYTHFTSPIRRYADQCIHRQLFDILLSKVPNYISHKSIVQLNTTKNKVKSVESELKWIQLANPDSTVTLHGKLLYTYDLFARVELTIPDNSECEKVRVSIPLVSQMIADLICVEETSANDNETKTNRMTYQSSDQILEFEDNCDALIELHWIPSQGLEGFRFEWLEPLIGEWIQSL